MPLQNYAVVGRIIGNDEASCYVVTADDYEFASSLFRELVRRDNPHAGEDAEVVISHILRAKTPISSVYSIQE